MNDLAKKCYEDCAVGATSCIRIDLESGGNLESFQGVYLAAKVMQENGQIFIQEVHHETQTGNRYVDLIRFMRVK